MSTLKAVRGTRDLLPPETELWNRIESTARAVFGRYNFGEIRTPIFEDTQLFARGVGEETDIVSKEMYTWSDGERFNQNALENAWLTEKGDAIFPDQATLSFKAYLQGLNIQRQVWWKKPGSGFAELVTFRHSISGQAIDDLCKAKFAAHSSADSGLQAQPLRMRLVVPASVPDNAWLERRDVHVEKFPGIFFSTSQSLTLRPENTAGVVRAYIEHGLGESGMLQKLYYLGPQFRRERPQKGRYRQFYQIGAEVIGPVSSGSESPLRDAELLEMLASFLDELGITGWKLLINSVGSASDRPRYIAVLKEALRAVAPQMCGDCQRRAETNPLRVLDCKVPEDQPIIETLPRIADYLDDESKAHFAAVCAGLEACGIAYEVSHRLVRGLDYYMRTTFEFQHGGLGAQNALLGGGRYDGLSEMIGGPKAPGIGFAIGADRLVLTLEAQAGQISPTLVDAYIAPIGDGLNSAALVLARELRRAGLRIEVGDGSFRIKKSFETGNKLARNIVLLGEDELQSGMLTVKNFASGEQTKIARGELASALAAPHE